MSLLCLNCDGDNIEYSFKYGNLLDLGNKIKKYTFKNFEFDKVDEILKNYITIHNKDYDIYFINCRFKLEFDNNFTKNYKQIIFIIMISKILILHQNTLSSVTSQWDINSLKLIKWLSMYLLIDVTCHTINI